MSAAPIPVRRFSTGQRLTLEPTGLGGGEGRIYRVAEDPGLMAKIYHPKKRTADQLAKLQAMMANPPADPDASATSIAWPLDFLSPARDARLAIGFLMPRVADARPIHDFYTPKTRRQELPGITYRYLLRMARNLAAAVSALHDRGYVVGDVNESNILASAQATVTLVDTDSFQVPDFERGVVHRCPVGKPEFTPPELQGTNFHRVDRRPEHDNFGLAAIAFQLLLEGTHPFDGVYRGRGEPPPKEDRILRGQFPHGRHPGPYRPKPIAPPFALLDRRLQALFRQCFEAGHEDPAARPDARAWVAALDAAEADLVSCAVNDRHLHAPHLKDCPWCRRARQFKGRDPFPSRAAVERGEHLKPVKAPRKARSRVVAAGYKGPIAATGGSLQTLPIPNLNQTAAFNPRRYWLLPGYSRSATVVSAVGFASCLLISAGIVLSRDIWDYSTPGVPPRIPAIPAAALPPGDRAAALVRFADTRAQLETLAVELEQEARRRYPQLPESVLAGSGLRAIAATLGYPALANGAGAGAFGPNGGLDGDRAIATAANPEPARALSPPNGAARPPNSRPTIQQEAWIRALYRYQSLRQPGTAPRGYFDGDLASLAALEVEARDRLAVQLEAELAARSRSVSPGESGGDPPGELLFPDR